MNLTLVLLPNLYAVCRLPADAPLSPWMDGDLFCAITRTADELSVVCAQDRVPPGVQCETDWRTLKVAGPLDFSLVGILASLAGTLATAGVSLFAVSTFDTDYLLVKAADISQAIAALTSQGHRVEMETQTDAETGAKHEQS